MVTVTKTRGQKQKKNNKMKEAEPTLSMNTLNVNDLNQECLYLESGN